MTLTTEQLRARAKFWREKAVEVKWESVSIAQDMLQNADAFDELAANREAPPAPAAPEAIITAPIEAMRCGPAASYVLGWNACRAAMLNHVGDTNEKAAEKCECSSIDYCENCLRAMLAKPVSSGYKLQDGWIACSERMPDDEQECLVQTHSGFRYVSFYDEHSGLFYDMRGGNQVDCVEHILVTHWMPLPAAPEGGNG